MEEHSAVVRTLPRWTGAAATLAAIAVIEAYADTGLQMPDPPAIFLLGVVFATFTGGLRYGLATAAGVWLYYAWSVSLPGAPFHFAHDDLPRLVVWGAATPAMALLVDLLGRSYLRAATARAESALRASMDRLSKVYRNSPAAIGVTRLADGVMLDINDAYERLFGWSRDEVIGRSVAELNIWVDPAERELFRERIRAEGRVVNFESMARRKNGETFYSQLSSEVIKEDGERLVMVIVMDVTEQRQREEGIRDLNADLERRVRERTAELAQAVHELESFTYSVSHDLRAPIRAITGLARILEEDLADRLSPRERDYLERINASALGMGRLIEGLLQLSRLGSAPLAKSEVRPEALVREVLGEHAADIVRSGTDVRVGPMRTCLADPVLLRQVYENLIGNALKYTSTRADSRIEIGEIDREGAIAYFVRDNGVGFDMALAGKLFVPFQRLHAAAEFEGDGIGLATAERIVARHGGRIWAEARVNEGASFYFTLGPETGPGADRGGAPA